VSWRKQTRAFFHRNLAESSLKPNSNIGMHNNDIAYAYDTAGLRSQLAALCQGSTERTLATRPSGPRITASRSSARGAVHSISARVRDSENSSARRGR
jgi:hypothetical protein